MAASSLGQYDSLSFASMKAHKNPKQLRVVVPSSISFPVLDSGVPLIAHPRPPYLPFRRISLPAAPSPAAHRFSIVSMESFESLPEERAGTSQPIPITFRPPPRRLPHSALDSPTRSRQRRRPVNDRNDEKRRRIINEFYETERSYFAGLELIYSVGFCVFDPFRSELTWTLQHFLTPIIESLETPNPLLDRAELTSIFVNFIDIWNLHRSFLSSLSAHLHTPAKDGRSPLLSSILLSHFPYLSLYSPFVTSFDTSLSSYMGLVATKPEFAAFIAKQEADPRCGHLKLRDWMLSIIQRCPRYLLLLKDLISCTSTDDPEHAPLVTVHTLVSKSMFHLLFRMITSDLLPVTSHVIPEYIPPHSCANTFTSRHPTQHPKPPISTHLPWPQFTQARPAPAGRGFITPRKGVLPFLGLSPLVVECGQSHQWRAYCGEMGPQLQPSCSSAYDPQPE